MDSKGIVLFCLQQLHTTSLNSPNEFLLYIYMFYFEKLSSYFLHFPFIFMASHFLNAFNNIFHIVCSIILISELIICESHSKALAHCAYFLCVSAFSLLSSVLVFLNSISEKAYVQSILFQREFH